MNHQGYLKISGSLLAKNTLLNFIGQLVPLLVGVVTIPFIVRGLGTERFGLLSLAWVILGYFTIFDLGLGRATTKFVAEALGKGKKEEIPRIVWAAVSVQALLGAVGSLALAGITPLLVERVLNIPLDLISEARATFYLLALSVPVVLVSSSFRGVLEASQRFDLVNAVNIPLSVLTFLLPLMGLFLGLRLPGIVALILAARVGAFLTYVAINFRLIPQLRRYSGTLSIFPRLFSFGGWITVISVVGPVLVYFDRFLIASLLSMTAVTYYTAPYEAVIRLWIIPTSLVMTLFPAFSALKGIGDQQRLGMLFVRSIKYTLLALGPIVLMLVLFAEEILRIWLGNDFAIQSTIVLQILALGVLVNSITYVPYVLLQGIGRPDVVAKYHLLELFPYVVITWSLVNQWGIVGAAMAWTLRLVFAVFLLSVVAFKVCRLSPRLFATNGLMLAILVLLLLVGPAYGLKSLAGSLPLFTQFILFLALFGLFTWVVWRNVLDASDRRAVLKGVKGVRSHGREDNQ